MAQSSVSEDRLRLLLQRRELMQRVTDGTTDRRELGAGADQSQSTVYRALNQLADAGVLTERNGYYETTPVGARLFTRVQALYAETTVLEDVSDTVPVSSLDSLDGCVLRGATTTESRRHDPHRPLEPVAEIFERSEEVLAATPVLLPAFERFELEGLTELVVERPALDARSELLSLESQGTTPEYVGVTEREVPFVLVVSESGDPECCVVVLDNGSPCVSFHNTSVDAVQWTRRQYRQFYGESESVVSGAESIIG